MKLRFSPVKNFFFVRSITEWTTINLVVFTSTQILFLSFFIPSELKRFEVFSLLMRPITEWLTLRFSTSTLIVGLSFFQNYFVRTFLSNYCFLLSVQFWSICTIWFVLLSFLFLFCFFSYKVLLSFVINCINDVLRGPKVLQSHAQTVMPVPKCFRIPSKLINNWLCTLRRSYWKQISSWIHWRFSTTWEDSKYINLIRKL